MFPRRPYVGGALPAGFLHVPLKLRPAGTSGVEIIDHVGVAQGPREDVSATESTSADRGKLCHREAHDDIGASISLAWTLSVRTDN
jgi:hypothetical protein